MDEYEKWLQDYQDEAEKADDMGTAGIVMIIKRKYRAFKAKAVEPLAALADRKGFRAIEVMIGAQYDILIFHGKDGVDRFFDKTYAAAEAKAREWLNKQEDK